MDAAGLSLDDPDLHLDPVSGDGDDVPPDPPDPGQGGGRGRRHGRVRRRVWPWILGVVALLGLERMVVWNVAQLDDAWMGTLAVLGAVAAGIAIAVGGLTLSRLRSLDAARPPS